MDPADITRRYLDVWNQTDPGARARHASDVFAQDVHYTDPLADVSGIEAVSGLIEQVQAQFPGARFQVTGTPDGHHHQIRFSWELGPGGGPGPVAGSDVAVLDDQGRIVRVLGFLDRVPA